MTVQRCWGSVGRGHREASVEIEDAVKLRGVDRGRCEVLSTNRRCDEASSVDRRSREASRIDRRCCEALKSGRRYGEASKGNQREDRSSERRLKLERDKSPSFKDRSWFRGLAGRSQN